MFITLCFIRTSQAGRYEVTNILKKNRSAIAYELYCRFDGLMN